MAQMALPLKVADFATFDSFVGVGNEEAVAALSAIAGGAGGNAFVWGPPATGKTHLMQAICAAAADRAAYVPLRTLGELGPEAIDGLASRDVVCIDDLDQVAGDAPWELGLFRLYNDIIGRNGSVVVAASSAPRECAIDLNDLASRLSHLPVYRLAPLDDEGRAEALKQRAAKRGLDLPDETARYLMTHTRRDMTSLHAVLERLDAEALQAQRRLTVPFVKEVLSRGDSD